MKTTSDQAVVLPISRRTVLKAAGLSAGAMMVGTGGVRSVRATTTTSSTSSTTTAVVPLTWGRSTESASGVAHSKVLGGAVPTGFGLPIDPNQPVWNGDQYYQFNGGSAGDISPEPSYNYATWRQWNDACASSRTDPYDETQVGNFEVRRFSASFDLPSGVSPADVKDVVLYSPAFEAENVIPINDNVYVRLNGTDVGKKGTAGQVWNLSDYGTATWLRDGTFPMTDGWYVDGSFSSFAANFDFANSLSGTGNTVDLVTEEYCNWGGMTYLQLKIVYEETCEPCPEDLHVKFEFDDETGTFVPEMDEDTMAYDLTFEQFTSKDDETNEPISAVFGTAYCADSLTAHVKAGSAEGDVRVTAGEDDTVVVSIVGDERFVNDNNGRLYAISYVEFSCKHPEQTE